MHTLPRFYLPDLLSLVQTTMSPITTIRFYQRYQLYPSEVRSAMAWAPDLGLLASVGMDYENFCTTMSPHAVLNKMQEFLGCTGAGAIAAESSEGFSYGAQVVFCNGYTRASVLNATKAQTPQVVTVEFRHCYSLNYHVMRVLAIESLSNQRA